MVSDNMEWFAGKDLADRYINYNPYFFEIKIGNGRITNIENIIIWVCFLWGFMRLIDLVKLKIIYDKSLTSKECSFTPK